MTDEAEMVITARVPQWSVNASVVCWGQACGVAKLEQYSCTGGPDPNQPRNVEKEAPKTMRSVPVPYWVPPASALFCLPAGENRKTGGLRSRSRGLSCSQLLGATSALSLVDSLGVNASVLLLHHWMSVSGSRVQPS